MSTDAALSPVEQAAIKAARRLGLPLDVLPCDPDAADTAVFCERYGFPPGQAGNTLIVASKKEPRQYAACLVLATTRLDVNHAVRDLLGVTKCSFATAEEMHALTGMAVGGVTVFGLPGGLPLFVDTRVMALDYVILGTGGRHGKIKTSPEALLRLPQTRIVEGLALAPKA